MLKLKKVKSPGLVLARISTNPELPSPLALVHTCLTTFQFQMDEESMGKQNLNHVEPVFDALMPTKVEFAVLKISLDKIPFWGNQNLSCMRKALVHLGVCEADCEVSSLV